MSLQDVKVRMSLLVKILVKWKQGTKTGTLPTILV